MSAAGPGLEPALPGQQAAAAGLPAELVADPGRRRGRLRRRFLRRPLAVAGLILIVVFVALALTASLLPYDPGASDFGALLQPPTGAHLLGTDDLGRDVLTRIAYGARVSLEAGLLATALAMLVAVPVGLVAGYYRGFVDAVIMRITDVLLAFPFLILAVGLAAILGASLRNVVLALGLSQLPGIIRITRGEVLGLREQDYVSGARADGAGDLTILSRYILPNALSPLIVQVSVAIPSSILGEAVLSFLGLGVQPPTPSWGVMLSSAQGFLAQAPYLAIFPGVAIVLATLAFNLLGDGLRDVLDPRAVR